jgi:hypothetical protein
MAGGNFDSPIPIDASGKIVPQGPFPIPPGETPVELYAWVTQLSFGGSDAFAAGSTTTFDPTVPTRWSTPGADHHGKFVPGPAIAKAVAISTVAKTDSNGNSTVEFVVFDWAETIELVAAPPATSAVSP